MRAWGRRCQATQLIQRSNQCTLAVATPPPDADIHFALIAQLQECWRTKCLEDVKQIHTRIIKLGKQRSRHVSNVLIVAYGKCGEAEQARQVFNHIPNPNVFSWTVLIAAFAGNGNYREALKLFKQMHLEGIEANQVTFITILTACASASDDALIDGISAHDCIRNSSYEFFPMLQTSLLDMYGKHGRVKEARDVFEMMVERDVIAWSAMLGATSQAGETSEAMRIYYLMSQEGVEPNEVTFISLAEACSGYPAPRELELLRDHARESGYESQTIVGNSLVGMLSKRGELTEARDAFWRITDKSIISWSIIVSAFAQDEDSSEESLLFFKLMLQEGVRPAHATVVSFLDACGSLQKLGDGRLGHSIVKWIGIEDSPVVATAALNMYSRCRCLGEAEAIFDRIAVSMRDVVAWTAMADAYQQAGSGFSKTLELLRGMDVNGVRPNEITFVTALQSCSSLAEAKLLQASVAGCGFEADDLVGCNLITFYGSKCGSLEVARAVFEEMPIKSLNTWNALLLGYATALQCDETLQLFQVMELEGIRGDEYTYSRLLEVYVEAGSLPDCRRICYRIAGAGFGSSLVLSNLLISAYGKCGSLCEARGVFERMRVRNIISWSAIIAAYARHGHSEEALEFYQRMDLEGVQPDDVTFITILFACSHSGMLHEGRRYFLAMVGDHEIGSCAKHYNCLVDLLGRAGWLAQAEELVNFIPGELSLYASTALLGACKTHHDLERAERIAARIAEFDPENAAPLCLL